MPPAARPDAPRGSVDLLILKALSLGATHGWGIGLRIQELSRGRLDANQGSLYPALQRLEHRGDIASEWRSTENNRRGPLLHHHPPGAARAWTEVDRWQRFAAAIGLVLEGAREPAPAASAPGSGRPPAGDAEGRVEEEFRFHLEIEEARLIRDGVSPDAAPAAGRVTLEAGRARETMRDERGARWLDDLGARTSVPSGDAAEPRLRPRGALTLGVG